MPLDIVPQGMTFLYAGQYHSWTGMPCYAPCMHARMDGWMVGGVHGGIGVGLGRIA